MVNVTKYCFCWRKKQRLVDEMLKCSLSGYFCTSKYSVLTCKREKANASATSPACLPVNCGFRTRRIENMDVRKGEDNNLCVWNKPVDEDFISVVSGLC